MYHDRTLNKPISGWSAAEDAFVRKLAAEGLSAGEISKEMRGAKTRCAVIGYCRRAGIKFARSPNGSATRSTGWLERRAQARREAQVEREERAHAAAQARANAMLLEREALQRLAADDAAARSAAAREKLRGDTSREGRPITDLGAKDCRYAVTGFYARPHRFCAEPVMGEGRAYCREHWLRTLSPEIRDKAVSAEARNAHSKRLSGQRF